MDGDEGSIRVGVPTLPKGRGLPVRVWVGGVPRLPSTRTPESERLVWTTLYLFVPVCVRWDRLPRGKGVEPETSWVFLMGRGGPYTALSATRDSGEESGNPKLRTHSQPLPRSQNPCDGDSKVSLVGVTGTIHSFRLPRRGCNERGDSFLWASSKSVVRGPAQGRLRSPVWTSKTQHTVFHSGLSTPN